MSINVNNDVSSIDTKRFSKPSTAASSSVSRTTGGHDEAEDTDTAEATVSVAARRLQEGTNSGASNSVGTEAGSGVSTSDTADERNWLDLAASMRHQIPQQASTAMLAQARNLPQQALALITG